MQNNQVVVDVRTVAPRERHPLIFNAWLGLPEGGSMQLVNDHDPLPLYYQFAAEHRGAFRWEYLEQGPATWRVEIRRGNYADPGFVPVRNVPSYQAAPAAAPKPLILDVRPIFAQGGSPCSTIDEAVASLAPGQKLVLLAPFEPAPLYGKLGAKGLSGKSEELVDGSWRIEFTPGATPQPASPNTPSCCSGH